MNDDRQLIEDYLPIEDISAESSREKSPRRATSRPLHLWWARRPLVACRTAVYGTLMPAPTRKENRDKEAAFVRQLAKCPYSPTIRAEARACPRSLGVGRARFPEPRFGTVSFPDRDPNESVAGRAECAPPRFPSKKMRLSMRTDGQLTS